MSFFISKETTLNKLFFSYLILLTSCSALKNPQQQPVIPYRDANTYKTTCSGSVENWGSCYNKANRTCKNGYKISDKYADSNGVVREMVFTCK